MVSEKFVLNVSSSSVHSALIFFYDSYLFLFYFLLISILLMFFKPDFPLFLFFIFNDILTTGIFVAFLGLFYCNLLEATLTLNASDRGTPKMC